MNERQSDRGETGATPLEDSPSIAASRDSAAGSAGSELRHALRTPLNHIIGYSELLLDEARERGLGDMESDLHSIHAAGKELLALTDRLFELPAAELDLRAPPDGDGLSPQTGVSEEDCAPAPAPDDQNPPGDHLLVVDDNESNRDIVSRFLRRAGYRVSCAADGAEALASIEKEKPDLVLLDVMMPIMNGIDVCRTLKDDPKTRLIPVVIMTALGQIEDRVRGIQAGADDFLTKPVNRGELLARIQTSLRLKQTVEDKVNRLQGAQDYLARFVPQSVIRRLEQNPDAPEIEKSEQDMSALFVDVSGYTRLSESMRQTADFVIEKYFSRYLDAVHAWGGDVTETSGDGLMVVFPGADPREHAIGAVTAALEILGRTRELNEQLTGIFDPISVHIGINSGIALIGPTRYEGRSGSRWVYTALGPAVNLAARVAGIAEAGMIYVGPETARRLEGRITIQEVGRRQLKNVRDEVTIHRVVGDAPGSRMAQF